MIHPIAACPFCGRAIVVDDSIPALLFDQANPNVAPCRHLAFLSASFEAHAFGPGDRFVLVPERSGTWLWQRGRGLWRYRLEEDAALAGLLFDIACDQLEPHEEIEVNFQVVGGDADEREAAVSGTGYFQISVEGSMPLSVELHGWAFYSRRPHALVRAVLELVAV
jgi:hypothetical protein